jgi:hypothetical protein
LGLAALRVVAMASTESKADDGFRFTLIRDTSKTDLTITATTPTGTIDTRTNIGGTDGSGGTGGIIGTIMIAIMIGIDA